jgi:hypothetical protein
MQPDPTIIKKHGWARLIANRAFDPVTSRLGTLYTIEGLRCVQEFIILDNGQRIGDHVAIYPR